MITAGFIRRIDDLGRIVLPKELRKALDVEERDAFEFFVDGDKIILKKYQPGDIFDGELNDLIEYKGKRVSKKSIREMAELAGYAIGEKTEE